MKAGILTLNFAKLGILFAVLCLFLLVYSDIYQWLKSLAWLQQPLTILFFVWLMYLLLVNIPGSQFPMISAKYFARVLSSFTFAGLFAIAIKRYNSLCRHITSLALFIFLNIIAVIIYLDSINLESFELFRLKHLYEHSRGAVVPHGFYQNRNELAWAAVIHFFLIYLFRGRQKWYLFIIILSWLISLWLIYVSLSRSSFLGFILISLFCFFLFLKKLRIKNKLKPQFILLFIPLFSLLVLLFDQWLPQRILDTSQQVISYFSFSEFLSSPKNSLEELFKNIALARSELWGLALDKFSDSPFTGLGLASFQNITFPIYGHYHTTHNFIYTLLVDQGLIGFSLLFFACVIFALEPYSLKKLLFLLVLPLSMLFDDLTPSYTFTAYIALWLGYMFAHYEPTIDWKAKFKLHFPTSLRFLAKGFQLLFFFIAAKYVALDIFGQFAYGLVVFSLILGPLLSLGVEQLLLRERVDLSPTHTASYRNTQFLVAIGTLGPLLLLGAALSFSINEATLLWLLFLLRAWEQTLLITWRAKKQLLKETLLNAVSRLVSLSLLIYSMNNSVSLTDLLTFQVAPLLYVIPFLLMRRGWFVWRFPFWRPGLVLAFSQLSWLLYYRVDQVMIEWVLSLEKVGVYEIAYRSFEAAVMPAALLLATPMALYARSSGSEALSICQQQAKRMLAWGGLGLIGACVAAVFLSFLYSEPSFTQLPAIVFILALGVIPVFLGSLYSQLLILNGHEKVFAKITLLITGLNLILNYFFLQLLGIYGAAIATVVCELLVFLACFALFRQKVLIQQVEIQ